MKISLLLLSAFIYLSALSQNKLLQPIDLSVDVDGQTLEVIGTPTTSDMTIYLYVVNTGSSAITLSCTRTELNVLPGTENTTCWDICPGFIEAGVEPVKVVALANGSALTETLQSGDTAKSFVGHHKPLNVDGCSLYLYEWKDKNTGNVYATSYVRYFHNISGPCVLSSEENLSQPTMEFYPNPVSENLTIKIDLVGDETEVSILNILGQTELAIPVNTNGSIDVNASNLSSGVYFVAIKSNGKVIKTEKLVVKH